MFYGSDSAAGEFNFDTSSSIDDSSVINAKHQDKAGPAKSRKRKGTKMEKVHVLSSVEPLPLPKQTLQPGSIPKFYYSPDYDDYYSAPLFKKSPSVLPGIWTFDNTGTSIIPEIWSSWKDRGYRLHPLFFLSITSNKPTGHEDHLLPFPISTSSYDGPSHGSINAFVQNNDSCVYSLKELLDEAGSTENTVNSKEVLVCGRNRAGDFIQLDLERDKVDLPSTQVQMSSDIDSFIWITDNFLANSMDLDLNIAFGAKPPFSVDNFVTVNLVLPPTDEQQKMHPQHRASGNFKLSQIPHMQFGHSGQDHRRVNFIVFFPRMTWKDSATKQFQTFIPKEVQDL